MVGSSVSIPASSSTSSQSLSPSSSSHGRIVSPARWLRNPLLTIGSLGSQVVWSSLMAFSSPYLLQLGLSKSAMALVFVAGPLSGLIVAPYIGVVSDNSSHPWGRRRPFLAIASILCSLSILLLGFARSIANTIEWIFGFDLSGSDSKASSLTVALVIISIFGTDFTVNAVSALNRALLLDLLPRTPSAQSDANAWAARLAGVGALMGFLFGNLDLSQVFPFKLFQIFNSGSSKSGMEAQLRCLSVIVVLILLSTQSIVSYVARESALPASSSSSSSSFFRTSTPRNSVRSSILFRIPIKIISLILNALRSIKTSILDLIKTARSLPTSIRTLYLIQFFAWHGWFPTLFYSSSWVSTIYKASHESDISNGELDLDSTRAGSRAMFFHSLTSFTASIILPMLITKHSTSNQQTFGTYKSSSSFFKSLLELPNLWAASHFFFSIAMGLTYLAFNSNPPSMNLAIVVTCMTGLSWSLTHWAPFALLGVLIESYDSSSNSNSCSNSNSSSNLYSNSINLELTSSSSHSHNDSQIQEAEGLLSSEDLDENEGSLDNLERNHSSSPSRSSENPKGDKVGTILGLHNVSIVLPQFVITILSSIIFAILEPGRESISTTNSSILDPHGVKGGSDSVGISNENKSDAIGVVLRIGGIFAIVAGILTLRWARRFKKELSQQ